MKLVFYFPIILILLIPSIFAHPGYNSEEQVIGRYRVSTSTIPEIPNTGENTNVILTIYDLDYRDIENFTASIRIFYNDQQVDYIPKTFVQGNHWHLDYIFERPGNHVFRVDVNDAGKNGDTITYTFNISTLDPFGYVFIYLVASGGIAGVGIMIWSIINKRKT